MHVPASLCRTARKLWLEWIRPVAVVAAIILPFKSAIADYNWVPTGSMKPTILEGDLILVNKLSYDLKIPFTLARLTAWGDPAPGDVVVLFSPEDGTRLVKRVIAGPGDTVEMRDDVLFLNGRSLAYTIVADHPFGSEIYEGDRPVIAREKHLDQARWVMALPDRRALRSFPRIVIPDGKYFVMGDSRDNSLDSRVFGLVERKQIVGRAERVLLSLDKNRYYVPRFARSFSSLE
jgi:signal peptidase I